MYVLVHLMTGPQDPTRVAMAFLVARTAIEAGHHVEVFIAGDAIDVLRPEVRDVLTGVGTGRVAEHIQALVAAGLSFHVSRRSAAARGIDPTALGLPVVPSLPVALVELIAAADRVVVY